MKVILFGGAGMVGQGVLRECLRDPEVTEVLAVMRSATGQQHAKLREIVHKDFNDFSALQLDGDACFWCLGVSSAGMSEADYTRITHDYTMAAAKVLARPTMTFIFVSGAGAQGNAMWAKWVTPNSVTDTERVGRAMLHISREGFPKKVLENSDINAASGG